MTTPSSTNQAQLDHARQEIDALDRLILNAVEQRAAIAATVALAKAGKHTFRPGREADLVRGLVAESSLPPLLVERIWRQIIGGNLTSQAPLTIAIVQDPWVMASASFRFGSAIDANPCDDANMVIDAVVQGKSSLGMMRHWDADTSWLTHLNNARQDGRDVYISSVSPFLAGQGFVDTVIIAPILPDPSQADMTLFMADGQVQMIEGYHPDTAGILGVIQTRDLP